MVVSSTVGGILPLVVLPPLVTLATFDSHPTVDDL